MTNYERALAAAKAEKERNRLREIGVQYALGPDSIEWVQYALMGDLAGRCEAAAEMAVAAAQAVQDEKAKPRASTLVVTEDIMRPLADEIARATLILRTDPANKVDAGLNVVAEGVMKKVAKSAIAIAPKWYVLRVLTLCIIGAAVFVGVGLLAGYAAGIAGFRIPVHAYVTAQALSQRAHSHKPI
uniref:Uncharacterized protein n=1 Tax=mine drainage metagenome TaxID=410659 RepID=E6Q2S6_9ZZZZ